MSNKRIRRLSDGQKKLLHDFIKKDPTITHTAYLEFCKSNKNAAEVSDAYFYTVRRELHGSSGPGKRSAVPLYLSIWSYPTDRLPNESKVMLQSLIETLNGQKRAHWQLVELKDPAVLELRERGK